MKQHMKEEDFHVVWKEQTDRQTRRVVNVTAVDVILGFIVYWSLLAIAL